MVEMAAAVEGAAEVAEAVGVVTVEEVVAAVGSSRAPLVGMRVSAGNMEEGRVAGKVVAAAMVAEGARVAVGKEETAGMGAAIGTAVAAVA